MNKLSKQSSTFKPKNLNNSHSSKLIKPIHSLVVRKINGKEKSSDMISKEINNCLNLPEQFFSPNSKVTIGKKVKLIDMKSIGIEKILPKKMSIINNRMSYIRKFSVYNNLGNNGEQSLMRSSNPSFFYSYKDKQQQMKDSQYEIIDNEQLKKIFDKYKNIKNNSQECNKDKKYNFNKIQKNNNSLSSNELNSSLRKTRNKKMRETISQSMSYHNNTFRLKKRQNLNKEIKDLSKHLSQVLNKNEKDLLLNKLDIYNFKKELLKEIEFSKSFDEKYGKYKWNISLRRPKNFVGIRNAFVNLSQEDNPLWAMYVEKLPRLKELKIKPGIVSKNKDFLEKFKKTYLPKVCSFNYRNIENLDNLSIKGENLFDIEYNREIRDNKNKKKLYKTFVDKGGKVFMKNEINNIFGEMTFCENHGNNNLLNIRYSNSSNNSKYSNFISKLSSFINNDSKNIKNLKDNQNSSIANDEILKKTSFKNRSSSII